MHITDICDISIQFVLVMYSDVMFGFPKTLRIHNLWDIINLVGPNLPL